MKISIHDLILDIRHSKAMNKLRNLHTTYPHHSIGEYIVSHKRINELVSDGYVICTHQSHPDIFIIYSDVPSMPSIGIYDADDCVLYIRGYLNSVEDVCEDADSLFV